MVDPCAAKRCTVGSAARPPPYRICCDKRRPRIPVFRDGSATHEPADDSECDSQPTPLESARAATIPSFELSHRVKDRPLSGLTMPPVIRQAVVSQLFCQLSWHRWRRNWRCVSRIVPGVLHIARIPPNLQTLNSMFPNCWHVPEHGGQWTLSPTMTGQFDCRKNIGTMECPFECGLACQHNPT